jgi:hypothetical protein
VDSVEDSHNVASLGIRAQLLKDLLCRFVANGIKRKGRLVA